MRLSQKEFDRFIPANNHVIVKPSFIRDKEYPLCRVLETSSGNKLYIDTSWQPELHTPVTGTVIKVPDRLICTIEYGMDWVTEQELTEGDFINFKYMVSLEALKYGNGVITISETEENYLLVSYQDIVVCRRDDRIIPLNGYVLCETIPEVASTILYLPESVKNKKDKSIAKVLHLGSLNKSYMNPAHHADVDNLSIGDIVYLDKFCHVPLEYNLWNSFEKDNLIKVQRRFIMGKKG